MKKALMVVVLALLLLVPFVSGSLVFERSTSAADIGLLGNNAVAFEGIATLFVYDGANALDYVAIRTGVTSGTPAENYYAYILDDSNASGAPGVQICKSNLLNLAGINGSSWDNNFTFSGCSPGNDTYWFALKTEANADTDYVVWRGFNGAPAHYSDTLSGNAYGAPGTFELDIRVFDLPASNTISTTAVGPPDGELTANSSTTILINYYYNDTLAVDASKVDCTLWYQTPATSGVYLNVSEDTSPAANVTENITNINAFGNETTYQWLVECGDGTTNDNTTARNLTIDRTQPPITSGYGNDIATANTSVFNKHTTLTNETIRINFNASDPHLFRYDFNLTLANGTHIAQYTLNDINATEWNYTLHQNLSAYIAQNLTVSVFAADGHTARWIEAIPYETTSNSVTFTYPGGYTCKLEAEEANLKGLVVEHSTDRMNWTITKNSASKEHGFTLDCNQRIEDISHRFPFPSFVIGSSWFDFAVQGTQPGEYVVTRQSETKFNVKLKYAEDTGGDDDPLMFSSTGLINTNFNNFTFEWLKTPVTPAIVSEDVGIAWIYTNWTAGAGANLYGVYRDGTNVANTSALFYNHTGLSDGTSYTVGVRGIYNDSDVFYENNTLSTTVKQTIFNGSLSVEVRNEVTNDVLSGPQVFISLLGTGTTNISGNTTTGTLAINNITSDNYTIRHSADAWGSRDQYLEIGENDSGSIILYLLNDSVRSPGQVEVNEYEGSPATGRTVSLNRWYGEEVGWRTVQMARTNSYGDAVMTAQAIEATYQIVVVDSTGAVEFTSSQPEIFSVGSESTWLRTIILNPSPTERASEWRGWAINWSPSPGALSNTTNAFSFTVASSYWNVSACAFRLLNESNNAVLNSTSGFCGAAGGTGTLNFLLINFEDVLLQAEVNTSEFSHSYERGYAVYTVEYGNATLAKAIDDMGNFSGSGFDGDARMLLALLVIIGIPLALASRTEVFSNPEVLLLLMFFLSILFSYMGWLTMSLPQAVGAFNQYGFTILFGLIAIGAGLRKMGVFG